MTIDPAPLDDASQGPARRGRPRTTSREAIAALALDLFDARGFEETTMDDLARALGISRKTLFNYFPAKGDIVWSDYERALADLQDALDHAPAEAPTLPAVADSVIHSLRLGPGQRKITRTQARLIDSVPSLHGHAATRGQRWADVIAAFIARREGLAPSDLAPRLLGRCFWTAMFTGLADWADSHDEEPETHLRAAFDLLIHAPTLR